MPEHFSFDFSNAVRTALGINHLCMSVGILYVEICHIGNRARDEAFCFAYAETLDALRDAGAELVFFSPLRDAALPENIGGLYLPGGYPELYAKQLSENCALPISS